ncbi:hypothetical protein GN244_ATG02017 [Phytophthora infestans]|uniref:Uncharacterized protein n=1 Tax=Phytophthora infestans TaxID=4787 RepID=A0A833TKQ0_PHYIN|nr:hypothetical protein GN244_ATG02017 [Phytophthora infestans]
MNRSTKASCRPTRGRKRVSDVPYSTELLRRKRVEAQTLLLEVQTLSTHLATLQEVRRHQINAVSTTTKGSSVSTTQWRGEAAIESEKRCRAEKLNRELKMKLRAPILKALEKTDALQGLEFVLQLQPKIQRSLCEPNFSELVLNEMSSNLDWLRLDTDSMLPVVDDGTNVSFRWQHVPIRNCILSSSVTPVRCAAEQLGEMLWRHASNTKKATDTSLRYIRRKTPTPLDMNAEASIVEGQLCNNAVATFRKYDEGDRIILVGTTKWFRPSDYNWTVISQSPITPLEACVARHCYKLEMTATSSIEASRAQKLLFHIVSSKMRCLYQDMQDVLLNSVDLVQDAS